MIIRDTNLGVGIMTAKEDLASWPTGVYHSCASGYTHYGNDSVIGCLLSDYDGRAVCHYFLNGEYTHSRELHHPAGTPFYPAILGYGCCASSVASLAKKRYKPSPPSNLHFM